MPIYHTLGKVPAKRHIALKKDGGGICQEQLMGNFGFDGPSSLLYHLRPPTRVKQVGVLRSNEYTHDGQQELRLRHFKTAQLHKGGSAVLDRIPLLYNNDVALSYCAPDSTDDFFFRNGMGDELIYVAQGEGVLKSQFGSIRFTSGDQLVIPRSILYKLEFSGGDNKLFIVEATGHIRTPKRYRNEFGQLLEGAPMCERDIKRPQDLETIDETGEFRTIVKQRNVLNEVILAHHPCDVVGWDGYYYPYAFNIMDFEPKVGLTHLPPPVHQAFECEGFVVCNFCPRPFDFHPEAVPAPYAHSNVMSDEVLFYASKEYMSRKGIEFGSITLHPFGLPHGPHPGRYEGSMGKPGTDEVAFMVDTFKPLKVAKGALAVEDKDYYLSWLEGK